MTATYHPAYRPRPRSLIRRLLAADSALHRVDLVLLGAVLLLCVFGVLLVWSATRANSQLTGDDGTTSLQRHVATWRALLLGAAVAALRPRALRVAAPVAYVVSLLGLVLVLSPLGRTYNGSHSWISLGGLSLQPAELAKVTLCLALALLLAERRRLVPHPGAIDVFLALAIAAIPTVWYLQLTSAPSSSLAA